MKSQTKYLKTNIDTCSAVYPNCPIRNILARVSDKWSMLVLHALSQKSPMRFTELRNAIGDATPKMLSASLKTLEEDGIVCRTAYPEIPPRVEYTLTSRGTEMLEAMQPLTDWAIRNMEAILRDRAARQQRTTDIP
ncbi:transcriptional regulator HxlR family [Prevotella sp. CAG:924]|nr:transcriptional regulator HxlR family [Prevotella sp. CAG:924]